MAEDYFRAELALAAGAGTADAPVPSAQATIYAATDVGLTTPLAITDLQDIPMPGGVLIAGPHGLYPPFKVVSGATEVIAVSGGLVTPLTSVQGTKGDDGVGVQNAQVIDGELIITLTDASVINAGPVEVIGGGGSGIAGAPSAWPSTFPAAAHSHQAADIANASTIGRQVMTALDQQAARAAIGAGTGNGTSNLTLGSGAGNAAPGNHSHPASAVGFTPVSGMSSTNVQDAIAEAAASGGGGGASSVQVVKYASGAYPALPTTKPIGVDLILFKGPVQPTAGNISGGMPSYAGDGPTQIMTDYQYRALT